MDEERIKRLFNMSVPFFDLLDAFSVANYNRKNAFSCIKKRIRLNNRKVPDIGCGTGKWSNLFKVVRNTNN